MRNLQLAPKRLNPALFCSSGMARNELRGVARIVERRFPGNPPKVYVVGSNAKGTFRNSDDCREICRIKKEFPGIRAGDAEFISGFLEGRDAAKWRFIARALEKKDRRVGGLLCAFELTGIAFPKKTPSDLDLLLNWEHVPEKKDLGALFREAGELAGTKTDFIIGPGILGPAFEINTGKWTCF